MRTSTLILLASGLFAPCIRSPVLADLSSFPLALTAHASPLFRRQEPNSSFEPIYKPAYESITQFTVEAFNKTQCRENADGCGGWLEDARVRISLLLHSDYNVS